MYAPREYMRDQHLTHVTNAAYRWALENGAPPSGHADGSGECEAEGCDDEEDGEDGFIQDVDHAFIESDEDVDHAALAS